ncbi:hypothetical protein FRUB_00873 [Fimbriiglobus ruber]|uniref:EF-hand domain-containing protein n=1 Tax=Fimbriiglobus ruber TaxID=1908690 RepID=A0A225E5Y1_9BACT|nr:hypothetical protein FRUB_00873 [Fimbriiglobus ruber]
MADAEKIPVRIGPRDNVAWKVPVPSGFSSPVVVGDKLFLTAFEDKKLFTIAYARADGKELWRKQAPAEKIEAFHKTEGSPAASTIATDGERVVAYFGSCGLICYDLNGQEQWRFEMPMAESGLDFGSGTSPVLVDGLVILVRDLKNDARLLAVNVKTGSIVWETKRDGKATAWSSPTVWETPSGKQLAIPGFGRMAGYDLKSGKEVWAVTGMPAACCTTPVVADGNLVFAGWSPGEDFKLPSFDDLLKGNDKNGNGALDKEEAANTFIKDFFDNNDTNKDGKITREEWDANAKFMAASKNSSFVLKPGGIGDVTKTHVVWKQTKGLPYVPSPLVYRGQVYTVSMRGGVTARDVKTGKDVYLDEGVGLSGVYASPVASNGNIYLFGLDGSVVVLEAGDSPTVVHRAKLGERVAATPAIVDGTLYVRTAKTLYAFAEKK